MGSLFSSSSGGPLMARATTLVPNSFGLAFGALGDTSHKMVFVVNMDLNMGRGKQCAQVAHAALGLYLHIQEKGTDEYQYKAYMWLEQGQKKIVLKGNNLLHLKELQQEAQAAGLPNFVVSDAGCTQIAPGSKTVLSIFGSNEDSQPRLFNLLHSRSIYRHGDSISKKPSLKLVPFVIPSHQKQNGRSYMNTLVQMGRGFEHVCSHVSSLPWVSSSVASQLTAFRKPPSTKKSDDDEPAAFKGKVSGCCSMLACRSSLTSCTLQDHHIITRSTATTKQKPTCQQSRITANDNDDENENENDDDGGGGGHSEQHYKSATGACTLNAHAAHPSGSQEQTHNIDKDRMVSLTVRQFYALIWKDWVVHRRHYVWTTLEILIPVLVCVMAIFSNSHQGKPRLEPERVFEPDDYDKIYADLTPSRHKLLVAPDTEFTRTLVEHIDDGAVTIEIARDEEELIALIKKEIPISLDQVKRLIPDDSANVTIGGVVIEQPTAVTSIPAASAAANSNQHRISSIRDDKLATSSRLLRSGLDKHRQSQHSASDDNTPTSLNGQQQPQPQPQQDEYVTVIHKTNGKQLKIPLNFKMNIKVKDFRLSWQPFPKKYSLGPFLHSDHYVSTYFIATQIMLSRAYLNVLANYVLTNQSSILSSNANANVTAIATATADSIAQLIPTNDELIGQRIPYPKYVGHKRLRESTLGTFVAGAQKQKPFVLTMDYCITVGFLVTAIFLAKRIVDEKRSRVCDMLRLVGVSDWTYYASHATNTMIIMTIQCVLITFLFTGHIDAPAQNITQTLLFAILVIYCLAAITFILALSTLFTSSTKAIICTSLLWLGLPEVIDRVFKMDSGVIESNGFMAVHENIHLSFCLVPNFALRLINRLLTECDIYGEFYAKKGLYGEYRAIWSNLFTVLPLYHSITVGQIMLAGLVSIGFYAVTIYLINSLADQSLMTGASSSSINTTGNLLSNLLRLPLKILLKLVTCCSSTSSNNNNNNHKNSINHEHNNINLNGCYQQHQGHINSSYIVASTDNLSAFNGHGKLQQSSLTSLSDKETEKEFELKNNNARYFEGAPKAWQCGVSIRNLCKTYFTDSAVLKTIQAVKNVSLDMYYSQILVLLGQNGAGKTTMIDIISGHNRKSSGQIIIDGYDIDTHPELARKRVGFCPQFDVLFERLTVEEHLYFYGLVKGAIGPELKREMQQLLQQSDLIEHRSKLSKALSGGYKRKLSLAIAMIADSRVLILDEPTSGMDPEARRKVWDFLQLIRADRLILMTTHHMEEADALGDRIAVMSAGEVRCCGSSLFLKRAFNAGYHLRISKKKTWSQERFDALIGDKYSLKDKLENCTPHEMMYQFDADETASTLPALFEDLETHKDAVGIFGFGVTVSTMDDVFMKIGLHFNDIEAQEMQAQFNLAHKKTAGASGVGGMKTGESRVNQYYSRAHIERLQGKQLFQQHMRALLAKRYDHARKNWFQIIWVLAISLSCILGIVILLDSIIFKEELTPEWRRSVSIAGFGYGRSTQAVYQFAPPDEPATPSFLSPSSTPNDTSTTSAPVTGPSTTISPVSVRSKRQENNNINNNQSSNYQLDMEQFFEHWRQEAKLEGINDILTYKDINSEMIDLLTEQFADFRERYIVGGEKHGKKYIAWYNGEATHAFPISVNMMINSVLRNVAGHIQGDHPIKRSRVSLTHHALAQINTLIAFLPHLGRLINLVFLPFSLAFITSYFVIFPTHERVTKSKHLQLMTGVSARTFWLSHFLFDLAIYAAYTTMVLGIYFVWDRIINDRKIYFANFEHSVALFALVSLFIFAALPLAYIFSFLAKKPTSAFSSFCVLTILTGTATLTLISLYELKYEANASATMQTLFSIFLWTSRLIPSVSLLIGLQKLFALNTTRSICINISTEVLDLLCKYVDSPLVDEELRVLKPERCCKAVCGDECFNQWPFFWTGWFGINTELMMLVVDAALLWFILTLIECQTIRQRIWSMLTPSHSLNKLKSTMSRWSANYRWKIPHFVDNQDLCHENSRIEKIIQQSAMNQYSMVVGNLTKVYSGDFHAVDNLSFAVDKQEFFGLLGVNGAGKSTTFKMLTGELSPTHGNSWIGADDLQSSRHRYLKQIGYCPQNDALIDNLSGIEMLTLFARLRGVPEHYIEDLVRDSVNKLGLTRIATINCNNYSGGNKRRLSVGIALIGAPAVVFLDEPTSGVDPRSRRRLWSTLIEFQAQTKSAIVMTSHSMNECECLCDRVAIMVGGQFQVLGSIQYLRTRLGQGFSLILKLKPENLNKLVDLNSIAKDIHNYMTTVFEKITLKDVHQTLISYHISPSDQLSWSKMLTKLEKAKSDLDLEDYQITSDTSLESIFLTLAKGGPKR
ncbi:ATP-binding cassette sub-family A member 3 [Fragariocoptes setiger]|uniref:peptidyl-tRNA hydrolase n=1 Tax=Fragariocoptes setiger TaxID=1670756 RepID=A0ABQ7S7B0_9ACAR|nr:ATP-binding cassette sub-family A member 3 [Fragariocoptes setiger]